MTTVESTLEQRTILRIELTRKLKLLPAHHALALTVGIAIDLMRHHGFDRARFLETVTKIWDEEG